VARSQGHVDGYALMDNELGKTEPITFLTALTPLGDVNAVEILAYREPYGGEVQSAKYLRQYQGKGVKNPIRVGQDITNMSGATISSRAVALGVKRAVSIWSCVYERP
jgi:electron transport complex protein RnfG